MKRIVIITPDYPPVVGGAEIFAGALAERLARRHAVHVVTRLPSRASRQLNRLGERPLPRREVRNGVMLYRSAYVEVEDLRMLTAVPGLWREAQQVIRRVRPHIVHTVTYYPTLMLGRLLKGRRAPWALVHTEQGLIVDVLRGYANILDRYGGILRPVTHWAFAGADFVTAVSQPVADKCAEFYPHAGRITVVPNGLDIRRFTPSPHKSALRTMLGMPRDTFVLFSASRLVEKNGVITLVESLARVAPDRRLHLYIAGEGDLRPQLEATIARAGLGHRVTLLGNLPHADLPQWLAAADAFVRPSVSEGFGIAFVEAMAAGLPVISTPVVADMDVYRPDEHGLVVPVGDAVALAAAYERLIDNPALTRQLAAQARDWAVSRYDWDAIVQTFDDIYTRLRPD